MAGLLNLSGAKASNDPEAIFNSIGREIPRYEGLDYDAIGPLGVTPSETPQEVLR
jgi:hypothetical protein